MAPGMQEISSITKRIFSSKILKKRAARIIAVQCLYSIASDEASNKSVDEKLSDIISVYENELSNSKLSQADHSYLIQLVRFAAENTLELENKISEHLLDNWRIERLPKVIASILKCATSELFLNKKLDRQIIINEYLEIAKLFNHEGETGFVNSVLDKISR
jgi:N utilization substance protein B